MKILFNLAALFLPLCIIFGQKQISGKVLNSKNIALPYVNVGIKNSEIASITDINGHYVLTIDNSSKPSDSIFFSALGFVEKPISIGDLEKSPIIHLDQKITAIDEVVVKAIQMKEKMIGEKKRPMLTFTKFFNQDTPTAEQGSVFKIFSTTKIRAYNFYIMPSSRFQELTLKLNIYAIKNGQPTKNLLQENVLYKTSTTGWQNIDLKKYKLLYKNEQEILVTLQLVDYHKMAGEEFVFGISAKKSLRQNLWYRYQSQGLWEQATGQYIANLDITYNKEKNEKEVYEKDEDDTIVENKLNEKLLIYRNKIEAQKTQFGKNESGKFVNLKDAKIYYETYGKGPIIVLLHGNGGQIADFYKQIPFLEKNFKVIAIDTRGQGKSTDLSNTDYSYELYAEDLYQLLRQINVQNINLVGWSDGGNTALVLASRYPNLVKKMVLIGANISTNGVDEGLLSDIKTDFENPDNEGDKRLLKLMLTQPKWTNSILKNIKTPTLVVAGENDIIKREHTLMIKDNLPNSELWIVPNAGHYVPFEKPELLNSKITDFLQR